MDVNWCLACSRHIDMDGTAPYCSPQCFASDQPSTSSAYPSPRTPSAPAYTESFSDLDVCDESFSSSERHDSAAPIPSGSCGSWIGKGHAGIQAWARGVHPGAPVSDEVSPEAIVKLRPPALLQPQRRPVPPTLCMSKTSIAPTEPSRPIQTPRQSVPSLSTSRCPTDGTSYTTPSSSVSLATPLSAQSPALPCALMSPPHPQQKTGLISTLTAQIRAWAVPTGPQKPHREATVTRDSRTGSIVRLPVYAAVADEYENDVKDELEEPEPWIPWNLNLGPAEKFPHAAAPALAYPLAEDDRPAYLARGRPSSRLVVA